MKPFISIIICTYNRVDILEEVLEHLMTNVQMVEATEVIVVDNNSNDETKNTVYQLAQNYNNLKYVFESKQGLSEARNRGCEVAKGDYLLYLDDDGLTSETLIIDVQNILEKNTSIKALGGIYHPWYRYGKPNWYKDQYASKSFKHQGLKILEEDTWSGGIMLVEKETLQQYSFDTSLGMSGGEIFYGEETDLQYRLEADGIPVYGSNDIFINHVVQPYKLTLNWFFKQKKALAKSMKMINNENLIIGFLKGIVAAIVLSIKDTLLNLPMLLKKNYYWQNFVIDTYSKPYKWLVYSLENLKK